MVHRATRLQVLLVQVEDGPAALLRVGCRAGPMRHMCADWAARHHAVKAKRAHASMPHMPCVVRARHARACRTWATGRKARCFTMGTSIRVSRLLALLRQGT